MSSFPDQSLKEKIPGACFLMPKERRYPFMVHCDNGDWMPTASALQAAVARAEACGDVEAALRGHSLYKKLFGKKKG